MLPYKACISIIFLLWNTVRDSICKSAVRSSRYGNKHQDTLSAEIRKNCFSIKQSVAVRAGLKIVHVMTAGVAPIQVPGFDYFRYILQRNRVRLMAFRAFRDFFLFGMRNILMRINGLAACSFERGCGFCDFVVGTVTAQACFCRDFLCLALAAIPRGCRYR